MDEPVRTTKPARRWPAEVIEATYQVYAGPAGGNVAETCRLLVGVLSLVPPETTVREWVQVRGWADRAAMESQEARLIGSEVYADRVWVAAPTASKFLLQVTQGQIDMTQPGIQERIRAAIQLDSTARSLLLKQADLTRPDQRRRKAAPLPDMPAVDITTMSANELEEHERQRRDRKHRDRTD